MTDVFNWQITYESPVNRDEWFMMWYDSYVTEEDLRRLLPFQKINHFPGSFNLGKKNFLAQNLEKMRKQFPAEYDFFPRTWCLPAQGEEFKKYVDSSKNRKSYFICKPENQCQGRGIFLMKRNQLPQNNFEHVVVQEYLPNPYLIDGLKFDLRIYVLLKSVHPLKIYMYPEGLARFATAKFHKPSKKNYQNMMMHLTNYAVNKRNPNFIYNQNEFKDYVGHKRSMTSILKYLFKQGKDVRKLYQEIR